MVRLPGIEPGSNAWEASMIAITLQAAAILPKMSRTSRFRFFYSLATKKKLLPPWDSNPRPQD